MKGHCRHCGDELTDKHAVCPECRGVICDRCARLLALPLRGTTLKVTRVALGLEKRPTARLTA